ILDRNPGYGLILPPFRIAAIFPCTQEIVIVVWMIVRSVEKSLELGIGHGCAINIETVNVHSMPMKTPRRIFPRILNIYPGIIAAFDFNATNLKVVVTLRD